MKEQWFVYKGRLPSLNEVIAQNRMNKYAGAHMKENVQSDIRWSIKSKRLESIKEPCVIYIDFHEKTKRRDVDNIQSATKFILDALVQEGVLPNDTQKWVEDVKHDVKTGLEEEVFVYIFEGAKFELKVVSK